MAAPSLWRGRAVALVGIILLAFSLRSAVASLAPLLDHIGRDIPLPSVVIGLIGTLPPACYAVAGLFAPALERRFGLRRLTAIVLVTIVIGLIARGFAPSAIVLLGATAIIFVGVGVGNVLLPPLVKRYFPDRLPTLTALYAAVMSIATFVPPLVAVPVADSLGWRISLALWAVLAVVALVPWITLIRRDGATHAVQTAVSSGAVFGRLLRMTTPWALAAAFGASSAIAYTSFTWLPTIVVETAGVSHAEAGALLSVFAFIGLPCSLIVPLVAAKPRGVPVLFAVAVICGVSGALGMLYLPAYVVPAVILFGICPLLFPLVLGLLSERTRTHETSVALSGFVQSFGYAFAATVPLIVGLLHDASGSWTLSLWMLAGIAIIAAPAGVVVSRGGTIEDEWERRHGAW